MAVRTPPRRPLSPARLHRCPDGCCLTFAEGIPATGMAPARIDAMHDGQHLRGYSDNGFNGSRPHLLNTTLADPGGNADEEEKEEENDEIVPNPKWTNVEPLADGD
ncbi:hypothetical protein ACFXJ6_04405 [Streptomyces sp. NPDC059218]|uniref:hypothetical protein n=2 Tax=unclassified Streptomyces TaxID=2593676 RepID=UPI0036D16FBA